MKRFLGLFLGLTAGVWLGGGAVVGAGFGIYFLVDHFLPGWGQFFVGLAAMSVIACGVLAAAIAF